MKNDRLEDLENGMNTERGIFISKDHQITMALDEDIISVKTRLTNGGAPPPPALQGTALDLKDPSVKNSQEDGGMINISFV